METKQERYVALVGRVREYFKNASSQNNGIQLQWCDECKEINLWTYWQGSLDARILLVGQDWGCPSDASAKNVIANIHAINNGADVSYMRCNDSKTNFNLRILFRELNYDIDTKEKDLFFTNFILGYRKKGFSGGNLSEWKAVSKVFFYELVDIIRPDVIICLGKFTFIGVLAALGKRKSIGNYNCFIESGENPISLKLNDGKLVKIYGVAHCGTMGTLNRNGKTSCESLEIQKEDWRRILKDISWRC